MKDQELKQCAKEITDEIYTNYGTDTGVLFGIPSKEHDTISVIVSLAIEYYLRKVELKVD